MAGQDVSIFRIDVTLQKGLVVKMTRRMLRREARYQVIMAVLRSFLRQVQGRGAFCRYQICLSKRENICWRRGANARRALREEQPQEERRTSQAVQRSEIR